MRGNTGENLDYTSTKSWGERHGAADQLNLSQHVSG